jgi:hypothetical protein
LVVPEHTPVVVFHVPPVHERTVTVSALLVAGAMPSVIKVDVPVAAIESPKDCEAKVPLLVSVTYLLTTSPGARLVIGCEKPAPLFAVERIKVPAESVWLADTVALSPAKTLVPATKIKEPAKTDVATTRKWWLTRCAFI